MISVKNMMVQNLYVKSTALKLHDANDVHEVQSGIKNRQHTDSRGIAIFDVLYHYYDGYRSAPTELKSIVTVYLIQLSSLLFIIPVSHGVAIDRKSKQNAAIGHSPFQTDEL